MKDFYLFKTISESRYQNLNNKFLDDRLASYKSMYGINFQYKEGDVVLHEEKFKFSDITIEPGTELFTTEIFSYISTAIELNYHFESNYYEVTNGNEVFKQTFNTNRTKDAFLEQLKELNNIRIKKALQNLEEEIELNPKKDVNSYELEKYEVIIEVIEEDWEEVSKKFINRLEVDINKKIMQKGLDFDVLLYEYQDYLKNINMVLSIKNLTDNETFVKDWDYKKDIDKAVSDTEIELANIYFNVTNYVLDEIKKINDLPRTDSKRKEKTRELKDIKDAIDKFKLQSLKIQSKIEVYINENISNLHSKYSQDGNKLTDNDFEKIVDKLINNLISKNQTFIVFADLSKNK